MRKAHKKYTNGEITVEWISDLCNHSGICINDLPAVFNILSIPWVDINGAPTEDIIRTVDDCPTGALTWHYNNASPEDPHRKAGEEAQSESPKKEEPQEVSAQVVLLPDGPVVIRGNFTIKVDDKISVKKNGIVSICRCGRSQTLPWCDGSHI
jgi:uncharacterized Fe-S cluster protein YjdI